MVGEMKKQWRQCFRIGRGVGCGTGAFLKGRRMLQMRKKLRKLKMSNRGIQCINTDTGAIFWESSYRIYCKNLTWMLEESNESWCDDITWAPPNIDYKQITPFLYRSTTHPLYSCTTIMILGTVSCNAVFYVHKVVKKTFKAYPPLQLVSFWWIFFQDLAKLSSDLDMVTIVQRVSPLVFFFFLEFYLMNEIFNEYFRVNLESAAA